MTITVVPSDKDVPLIQNVEGTPKDIAARLDVFFNTAAFIEEAGGEVTVKEKDRIESRAIFNGAEEAPPTPTSSAVALHLKALVNEYDHQVLESNIQARQYIVNRLLDISDPNKDTKPMEQLKALELLGKVSEIGLFMERVEVNINTRSTAELEEDLVKTLTRYMGQASVVESSVDSVLGVDLDEELGRKPKQEVKTEEKNEEKDDE
jgi:dihydroxyacid dehydratase/phosphogluconate dehydratase